MPRARAAAAGVLEGEHCLGERCARVARGRGVGAAQHSARGRSARIGRDWEGADVVGEVADVVERAHRVYVGGGRNKRSFEWVRVHGAGGGEEAAGGAGGWGKRAEGCGQE
eukprot:3111437-Pleurochrysis_carterae.AAC.1